MRKIFFIVPFIAFVLFTEAQDINVTNAITFTQLCNTLNTNGPIADLQGRTLRFQNGGAITGVGTITNGSIDADYNLSNIFDVDIMLENVTAYNQFFSARWFGVDEGNADNYIFLQRAIDVCIHQPVPIPLFIPPGIYDYSQPLLIANIIQNSPHTFGGCSFHMFGGTASWSSRDITTLNFKGPGDIFALGIQDARGVEVNNLKIIGQFEPPATPDNIYFHTVSTNYNDVNNTCRDEYTGIVIDPYYSKGPDGGSIGVKIHDVFVSNFAVDFSISPTTCQNSQMLVFENIQLGDSKWGFKAGSGQSKGNVVRGLYSTGRMHTLICLGDHASPSAAVGFWTFDKGTITNKCIRLCDIIDPGWYSVKIKDFFCENIGTIGTILTEKTYDEPGFNTEAPIYFEGCNFDFVPRSKADVQLLANTSDQFVKFESCSFRYFSLDEPYPSPPLYMNYGSSPATFDNCTFSGTVTQDNQIFHMY